MTATLESTSPHLAALADLARSAINAGPAFFRMQREAALTRFVALGFPTTAHEDWKFTRLSGLAGTAFAAPDGHAKVRADEAAAFAVPGLACHTLVFVDGRHAPQFSNIRRLPEGVRVCSLREACISDLALVEKHLGKQADVQQKAFEALNTAFLDDGLFVHVPRGKVLEDPIHVVSIATSSDTPVITNPRNLIIVGDNAQVAVIEHYVTTGDSVYFTNAVTEFVLGDNAHAGHYLIEEEGARAFQVSSLHARIGRASTFDSHSVLLGGALVRNEVSPTLDGEGGHCLVNGLFVGGASQVLDNFMFVKHMKPHCESHQFYNGILNDHSRGVFSGRIFVDQIAQKTDAKQTSANLLLSDDAQIDTKPQLEIYADDVKCTHGATIGQLDEDAMFYLRSRGISQNAARAMLVFAFAAETFGRMKLEPIREMLERKMLSRLPEGEFLASVL
jgi:Fe-S cluster assembly protein SufD